ncbi:MAG TPA: FG-GAP-like repeat-containing protein [Pyrinomonadaceae bacterium]|jgi:subtilisin-like proprotein convertase family protein|nr:FG-GAP-like repeat-containing protein [Pyrinomonadaceae bacterium]
MKTFLRIRTYPVSQHSPLFEEVKKHTRKTSGRLLTFIAACFAVTSSFAATFPADVPSLGPIPDSDIGSPVCQNNSTTFRDVTFTVTGISGTVTSAVVSFSASHTFLQDLEVSLRGPGMVPSHLLFSSTGTTSTVANTCAGNANDLSTANTYTFSDAGVNWWTTAATNPVPTSTNRTVVAGPASNPPAVTNLSAAFAGVSANGTWTLRFRDRGAGDTGTVTAASLTITGAPPVGTVVDMNGDGKTDWVVVRNLASPLPGQVRWFIQYNGAPGDFTQDWGQATDYFTPGDYDGDGKSDIAVWRPLPDKDSTFYIINSATGTVRIQHFGLMNDDPRIIGDYDGDGKDDIALYRSGNNPGDPSFWFWDTGNNFFGVQWGQNGDVPAPGDYDGDLKADFVVKRNGGSGQAHFWSLFSSTATVGTAAFGIPTDRVVPGDYDGDNKTDIAVVRNVGGQLVWFYRPSNNLNSFVQTTFGLAATDFTVQGDYDGDGRTDQAVWRPNADPTQTYFYVNRSGGGGLQTFEWGQNGDYPVANYNTH